MNHKHFQYPFLYGAGFLGCVVVLSSGALFSCGERYISAPTNASIDGGIKSIVDGRAQESGANNDMENTSVCAAVKCQVQDDCCACRVWNPGQEPVPAKCLADCSQSSCSYGGFKNPVAYCLKGECLLTDEDSCIKDSDCTKINDCCTTCLALPKYIDPSWLICETLVPCPAEADTACGRLGLTQAQPRCVGGRCQLVP